MTKERARESLNFQVDRNMKGTSNKEYQKGKEHTDDPQGNISLENE